jgi:hypothetical protein
MKVVKHVLALILFVGAYSISFAQDAELLDALPGTKEEFISSEKKVLATINWLENTPLDQDKKKHKEQYALLTAWITNSPTVTIELNANVLTFSKKNSELIMFFMAGWTKYSLENNYSKDIPKGSIAGLHSAINIYKKGVGLKKDKEMEKLVQLEEKGELEKWVDDQLARK